VSSMREIYEAIAYGYQRPQLATLIDPTGTAGADTS
jgi:hypothetical protein